MEKHLNALLSCILTSVVLAALGVEFLEHEDPCPLCLLQRLGMIAVAIGALLNIFNQPRNMHYGVMLFASIFGGFVALRQISLHVCPGFPVFGTPVLGLSLYTWSFIVFVCCIAYIALLLILFQKRPEVTSTRLHGFHFFSLYFLLIISALNILITYSLCGLGPCAD